HRTPKTYEVNTALTVMTGPTSYLHEPYKYQRKMGAITLDKLDYKMTVEMLYSIQSRKMPKKEPLSDADRKLVTDYLKKRMLDNEEEYDNNFLSVRPYSEEKLVIERQNILSQIPQASEEQKQKVVVMVNCVFGQKDCDQHVANQRVIFEQEAA